MTEDHARNPGFGFAAQMARADLLTFTRWYAERSVLTRPTMAECTASLSEPEPSTRTPAAARRDAA